MWALCGVKDTWILIEQISKPLCVLYKSDCIKDMMMYTAAYVYDVF